MNEWNVVLVIISLVTIAFTIGTPIIKLNTSITKLITKLDALGKDFSDLEQRNHKSHERLWEKNEEQDKQLVDHENRIQRIEEKER